MSNLISKIKEHSADYGALPFWSWNDKLEEKELRRQIRNMYDMNMRGFFMHARGGLETEYLSDEWFDCVKACVDEAKKLGMEAWGYDENGWPSGFAGGKLLENADNHAVYLVGEILEDFPQPTNETIAIYAFDEKGFPYRTDQAVDSCRQYLRVEQHTDATYVDTMRDDVTERFIETTHKEYQRRLGADFGKAMLGFFTDEPQYYRAKTPYSKKMEEWFLEEYGYSVLEALPSLFCDYDGAETHRYDYWRLASLKFTANFSKKIYDWAEKNGTQITGHFIDEESLHGQMTCCGDIMPQYLYEHIPGVDYLSRYLRTDLAPKQLGSVCAQTGRLRAISEMFAMCGWDVTPKELKRIAELQYANGVNVMCHHLYAYSIRGERKRDYPAFYSEHSLWQKDLKDFDSYFNNLGYMLSMGKEYADILVIHPMHSAWLTFKRDGDYKATVKILNDRLIELTYLLSGNQVPYHFGSETVMKELSATVSDQAICVGECSYYAVIVPACDTLDAYTVELLKQFKKNGGKIYTYHHHLPTRIDGRLADLSFLQECEDITDANVFEGLKRNCDVTVTSPDCVSDRDLRMMVRNTEYGRLIYLTNLTSKEIRKIRVSVKNCVGLGKLGIDKLDLSAIAGRRTDDGVEVLVNLMDSEAVVLYEQDAPAFLPFEPFGKSDCIVFENPFVSDELPRNLLTLDRAYVSLNDGTETELRPMERIRDNLLRERFHGKLTLSFPFEVKDIPSQLEVITEPMGTDVLCVNGIEVKIGTDWAIDRRFRVTDIAPHIKIGENRIEITIQYWQRDYVYQVLYGEGTETLRNSLVFDTEIENLYLRGNFALDMKKEHFAEEPNHAFRYDPKYGMPLIMQKKTPDISNLVTDGYPFYCGEITVATQLFYRQGNPSILHLTGRYATVHISVNGKPIAKGLFDEYVDIKEYLIEGDNTITLTLCNNYRNLLGPHHGNDAEAMGVGPKSFSMEKRWKDRECAWYDERYSFVRFGIDV